MKIFAYFLPGFHRDPLNDKWWGEGFTEWDNIRDCQPLYEGHLPNVLPKDGIYDLSEPNVLNDQICKIKNAGIDGVVIYDYWSLGVRPLCKIIDMIVSDQRYNIPFSICWANHAWSRSWKNKSGSLDLLLEQSYDLNDLAQFSRYVKIFEDKRYIKVDGKPFFQIYNPQDIPRISEFIDNFRSYVLKKSGLELHLSCFIKGPLFDFSFLTCFDSITIGNPTATLFAPDDLLKVPRVRDYIFNANSYIRSLPLSLKSILYKIQDKLPMRAQYFDYTLAMEKSVRQFEVVSKRADITVFPSVFVGFDNTPRYRNRAKIVTGLDSQVLLDTIEKYKDSPIVFLNAWNEWGEGMAYEKLVDESPELAIKLSDIKNIKK